MLENVAQKIADATSDVISHNVLITDKHGIVLGSSDLSRIGTLHQASLGIIFSRKEKTHNENVSKTMVGVKPGITLPINLSGELIGTIGITGNPGEVKRFGMLAKKYAELFLREELLNKKEFLKEKILQNLVQEIASYNSNFSHNEILLLTRGKELGLDLNISRVVLVIDLFQFNSFISDVLKNNLLKDSPEMYIQSIKLQIEEKIREVFYRNQDFSVSLESDKYIVFCVVSKTDGEVEIYEEVYAKCIQFLESIKEIGIEASVGIGRVGSDLKSLHNAYYTAWEALRIGKKLNKTPKIYYINHYIIEELFSYVHQEFSENYINHTLKELKQLSNFDEMFQTIIVWCETNFSVVKAAKQLNIHRNTLLYRLEKLSELTGKDLKDFKSAVSLYLAIKLDILNS